MSEPCEHQKDEAAWIWAQQLRFVTDERDAALAEVERLKRALADDIGPSVSDQRRLEQANAADKCASCGRPLDANGLCPDGP